MNRVNSRNNDDGTVSIVVVIIIIINITLFYCLSCEIPRVDWATHCISRQY